MASWDAGCEDLGRDVVTLQCSSLHLDVVVVPVELQRCYGAVVMVTQEGDVDRVDSLVLCSSSFYVNLDINRLSLVQFPPFKSVCSLMTISFNGDSY